MKTMTQRCLFCLLCNSVLTLFLLLGDDSVQINVVDDLSVEITNDEPFYPTDEWQIVKEGNHSKH